MGAFSENGNGNGNVLPTGRIQPIRLNPAIFIPTAMTIFSSTEQVPLLVKISDTDVEYTSRTLPPQCSIPSSGKSICGAAAEKATHLPRLLAILLPYLLVVFVLTAFVFLGGTYGHRIESRNLKMIVVALPFLDVFLFQARSWDPTKPRWYQLIRVASGYEIGQSDGAFQNLSYPECTSCLLHFQSE